MIDLRKVGRGDRIIDCISESFEVIRKTKKFIIVADKQDLDRSIIVPKAFAKKHGNRVDKGYYLN